MTPLTFNLALGSPKPTNHPSTQFKHSLLYPLTSASPLPKVCVSYSHANLDPQFWFRPFIQALLEMFPTRKAALGPTLRMPFCVDSNTRLQNRSRNGRNWHMPISRLYRVRYYSRRCCRRRMMMMMMQKEFLFLSRRISSGV